MSTPKQRLAIAVAVWIAAIVLFLFYWRHPIYFSNPPPQEAPQSARLASKVDPNIASWQELAMLPEVGESRARAIVQYRLKNAGRAHGRPVFARLEDLMAVRGIGVAMTEKLRPYLVFPGNSVK